MVYQTIFDITTAGYKSWSSPAFGLIFVGVGIALVLMRKSLPGSWQSHPRASSAFAFFFFGFAVLWTLVSFGSTYRDYQAQVSAIEHGSAKVIEGSVSNFQPMPVTGHAMERFCVQGTCFAYSDYVITAGFNNTSSHGGPIREGLPVRVTYVGCSIVKLEVAK